MRKKRNSVGCDQRDDVGVVAGRSFHCFQVGRSHPFIMTARRAVTGFAALFINRGVSYLGFTVRRQRVMSRFGGVAFGAGLTADVLAGVNGLPRLRLRGVFAGLFLRRLALGQRRGQRRNSGRDRGHQRRKAEDHHQNYFQSSHELLIVCFR